MPIEGFDYENFANNLSKEADQVLSQPNNAVPETITEDDKKNIVSTIQNLCKMAGEALNNDPNLRFTAEQATLIVQCVGEWTFHKSIDFINGKIPDQFRVAILNEIVRNLFQAMKLALIKNMPQETVLQVAEQNVKNTYRDELQKLVQKGAITKEHFEAAIGMSNLDNMAQKNQEQQNLEQAQSGNSTPNEQKILKLAALAIILKRLPKEKADFILRSLNQNDLTHVYNYMHMPGIEDKIDHSIIMRSLDEIKNILPKSENVNTDKILRHYNKKMYTHQFDTLENLAKDERENVKGFILDRRFPAVTTFSPHVIQALANIVEEKLNDN